MAKASSGGIRAGKAFIELFVKNSMGRGLNTALRQFSEFGARIRTVGIVLAGLSSLTLAPLVASLKEMASSLGDLPSTLEALHRTGVGLRQEEIDGLLTAVDLFDDLSAASRSVATALTGALGPAVEELRSLIKPFVQGLVEWIRNNPDLIQGIAKVAAVVAAVGGALTVLGPIVSLVVATMGAFAAIVSALANPIVLLAAGISALVYAMIRLTTEGKSLARWMSNQFTQVLGIARDAIGGIVDALMSGELTLAAKIAWTGMQLAFHTVVYEMRKLWLEFKNYFIDYFSDAVAGAKIYAVEFATDFEEALVTIESTAREMWHNFSKQAQIAMLKVSSYIEKAIVVASDLMQVMALVAAAATGVMSAPEALSQIMGIEAQRRAVFDAMDADTARAVSGINSSQDPNFDADLQARLSELQAQQRQVVRAIVEENERGKAARRDGAEASLAPDQDRIQELRDELSRLIAEAAGIRSRSRSGVDIGSLKNSLSSRSFTTNGTFNGSALSRMGFGGGPDRQTRAAEETADNTREILRRMRNGQVVWGN